MCFDLSFVTVIIVVLVTCRTIRLVILTNISSLFKLTINKENAVDIVANVSNSLLTEP